MTAELEATRARLRESFVSDMAAALVESAPDIGLSCGEAESIAAGLAMLGHRDEAVSFLVGHGQSESEDPNEDEHHQISAKDAWEVISTLTSL